MCHLDPLSCHLKSVVHHKYSLILLYLCSQSSFVINHLASSRLAKLKRTVLTIFRASENSQFVSQPRIQEFRQAKPRFEPHRRDQSGSPIHGNRRPRGFLEPNHDRMQLNTRPRNQSFRNSHGPDKKKFSDWQNWDELVVELGNIPARSGAREIFRAFKEYGCIVYIRMDEINHTGQIRFR
jgi:hypothetical protein